MKKQLLALLCLLFFISTLNAQSLFMKDFYDGKNSLSFNYSRLAYENSKSKLFNGVYKLGYMHPVSSNLAIEGQISYINNSGDTGFYSTSESGIGNIYLGINKLTDSGNSNYSLGIYIPTASDNVLTNPELFVTNYNMGELSNNGVLIRGNYQYQKKYRNGLILGIEAGPDFWIATNDDTKDNFEMFIHAAGKIGYDFGKLKLFGEIGNQFIVTEDPTRFKDRFSTHFGLGAAYNFGNYEIGFNYKNTFDKTATDVTGSFGVNFRMIGF